MVDMEGLDVMNTSDPAMYWYWLDMEDTMLARPGEPTNLERHVSTGVAIRWAEIYEEDRRKLNELYEWSGIGQDTPIAQVMGGEERHRARRPVTTGICPGRRSAEQGEVVDLVATAFPYWPRAQPFLRFGSP